MLGTIPDSRDRLSKLSASVATALETIRTREKGLQSQHAELIREHRTVKSQLDDVQRRHAEAREAEADRTQSLTSISEELDTVKVGVRVTPAADVCGAVGARQPDDGCWRFCAVDEAEGCHEEDVKGGEGHGPASRRGRVAVAAHPA